MLFCCSLLSCFLFCRIYYLQLPAASLALLLVCFGFVLLPPVVWYSTVFSCRLYTASRLSSLTLFLSFLLYPLLSSHLLFIFDFAAKCSSYSVLINKFTHRTTLHQRHTKEWLAATLESSDNDSRSAKCVLIIFLFITMC